MSGGVDSTYSALKLIREGHEVEGCVLVMHEYTDVDAAKRGAEELGIPLHVVDCREDFDRAVKPYFVSEYLKARTPNPCIVCNPEVKFKHLCRLANEGGFDAVATGHYARVIIKDGHYAVVVAADASKDQSYMLARLPESVLKMLVLPLADEIKTDVRTDAERSALSSSSARDSQEICFLPDNDYAAFIESVSGASPHGSFIDEQGHVLGEHNGIIRYTVGQRKGLGIALGARAFVTEISPENNTVRLSLTPSSTDTVTLTDTVYSGIDAPAPTTEMRVSVKLRYKAPRVSATAVIGEGGTLTLSLDEPARSVTPGQAAVIYDGDTVIACGFIDKG